FHIWFGKFMFQCIQKEDQKAMQAMLQKDFPEIDSTARSTIISKTCEIASKMKKAFSSLRDLEDKIVVDPKATLQSDELVIKDCITKVVGEDDLVKRIKQWQMRKDDSYHRDEMKIALDLLSRKDSKAKKTMDAIVSEVLWPKWSFE